MIQLSHLYMTTGKTIALTMWIFISKVIPLLFNTLSRFVIAFLPKSNSLFHGCSHHLQWFWSPRKWSLSLFPLFPHLFAMKLWDLMPWSSFIECWILSQFFHSPLSLSSIGSLVPLCNKGGVICVSEVIDISPGNLDSSLCFIWLGISHDVLCI